jgi:hypothetical protein
MPIEFYVQRATPNGSRTQNIVLLLKQGNAVRYANLEILQSADPQALTQEQLQSAWNNGTPADPAMGLRQWEAAQQRAFNEIYDQTLYVVTQSFRAGGSLTEMVALARTKLTTNALALAQFQRMEQLFLEADETTRLKFMALAITVFAGKVGQ